jgi:hypothetical protein
MAQQLVAQFIRMLDYDPNDGESHKPMTASATISLFLPQFAVFCHYFAVLCHDTVGLSLVARWAHHFARLGHHFARLCHHLGFRSLSESRTFYYFCCTCELQVALAVCESVLRSFAPLM